MHWFPKKIFGINASKETALIHSLVNMPTFKLQGRSSYLSFTLPRELDLDFGNWEIGLIDLHTYNHIPNVDETNNIFVLDKVKIPVPTGRYEIEDLSKLLNTNFKKQLKETEDVLAITVNPRTFKSEMISRNYKIDLKAKNSLASLLGFYNGVYPPGKVWRSQFPVNINPVEDINVVCNIAEGAVINGEQTNVIYGFCPSVGSGVKIIERPNQIIYHPVNSERITDIKVKIVDQNNILINNQEEIFTVRLHLRREQ